MYVDMYYTIILSTSLELETGYPACLWTCKFDLSDLMRSDVFNHMNNRWKNMQYQTQVELQKKSS